MFALCIPPRRLLDWKPSFFPYLFDKGSGGVVVLGGVEQQVGGGELLFEEGGARTTGGGGFYQHPSKIQRLPVGQLARGLGLDKVALVAVSPSVLGCQIFAVHLSSFSASFALPFAPRPPPPGKNTTKRRCFPLLGCPNCLTRRARFFVFFFFPPFFWRLAGGGPAEPGGPLRHRQVCLRAGPPGPRNEGRNIGVLFGCCG